MKAIILAGGLGTRLSEHTGTIPKPMVEIGGMPILWHIMHRYALFGVKDFVVALGYKGEIIRRWFEERARRGVTRVSLAQHEIVHLQRESVEDWNVILADTGADSMTGGRLARLRDMELLPERFHLTYGDGVSDVDLHALVAQHERFDRAVTITAVRPPARFGGLVLGPDDRVDAFAEKRQVDEGWINGGFMIVERDALSMPLTDLSVFEKDVLERMAEHKNLTAYPHEGFWQCMDTLRDVRTLEDLWQNGERPWMKEAP